MSDTFTSQSGGIDIDTAGPVNIGGDIAGRDIVKQEIHHEALAPLALNLHQLPPPLRDFTGRQVELEALLANFAGGASISGVRGMGGIGKTALALKLADLIKDRYPDAQFYINLRGASNTPMPVTQALSHVIRAYYPTSKLPDNEVELQALYQSVLHDKRALVLLDDVKDSTQVRSLLPPASCGTLITTRNHFSLPGLIARNLETLLPNDAHDLLLRISPRIGQHTPEIAKLCGYLPLALRSAASLIEATPDLDPVVYISQLYDEYTRLERIGAEGVNISVEALFNLSYANLSPDAARIFRLLSIFAVSFDATAEESIYEDQNHSHLSALVRLSLVQYDDLTKRYSLHELTRLFAKKLISANETYTAKTRHLQYYYSVLGNSETLYTQRGENIFRGLALFDIERDNIEAGFEWIKANRYDRQFDAVCSVYTGCWLILDMRLNSFVAIDWIKLGLRAARKLGNRKLEGTHLTNLGLTYSHLGKTQKAIGFFQQALKIDLEISDRNDEVTDLINLGDAYSDLGDDQRAVDYYQQAHTIAKQIGDELSEGKALGSLGTVYNKVGEFQKALDAGQRTLTIFQEIGYIQGEGTCLTNLGNTHLALGDLGQAIACHKQALAIFHKIGDQRNEGGAFVNLGNVYLVGGESDEAIRLCEQALAVHREIIDPKGEATDLNTLGNIHFRQGEILKALEFHKQSLAIAKAIGNQWLEGHAIVELAHDYAALGEYQQCSDYLEQALLVSRSTIDRLFECNTLADLGYTSLCLGNPQKGLEYLKQAFSISNVLNDRQIEAKCNLNLSLLLYETGEQKDAVAHAEVALGIYEQINDPLAEKVRQQLANWKEQG